MADLKLRDEEEAELAEYARTAQELWLNLGDDGLREAAYRGG
jgi:hypothetical protein